MRLERWVIVLVYLAIVNSVTLLLYGMDKKRAENQMWRISEKTLLKMGMIGGGLGAMLGMFFFHHKTQKKRFRILVPCSIALWAVIVWSWLG